MKKFISIIFCIISILSLSACTSSSETEYERIQLTKDNWSDYLSINVYVDDYFFVITEQTGTSRKYDISVVVHIETSKKVDCTFDDVSISYSPLYTPNWDYTYTSFPKTTVNLEGESHISCVAMRTHSYINYITTSDLTSTVNIVQSINGFVVVPKA